MLILTEDVSISVWRLILGYSVIVEKGISSLRMVDPVKVTENVYVDIRKPIYTISLYILIVLHRQVPCILE